MSGWDCVFAQRGIRNVVRRNVIGMEMCLGRNLEINAKIGGNNRAQVHVCLNRTVGEGEDSYTILTQIKRRRKKVEQATSNPARLHVCTQNCLTEHKLLQNKREIEEVGYRRIIPEPCILEQNLRVEYVLWLLFPCAPQHVGGNVLRCRGLSGAPFDIVRLRVRDFAWNRAARNASDG